MEFNEKLQELRKGKKLTQEELAQDLFVSRTAISKWESGRGYPSIDSLKEISRYFSVSIDELICPQEIISAAEEEKQEYAGRTASFICGALDLFAGILLLVPVFGNGADSAEAVSLFGLTGTALNGLCGLIILKFNHPVWDRHRLITGMMLSIVGVAVFIASRQPYAGIIYFALLVIKTLGIMRLSNQATSGVV